MNKKLVIFIVVLLIPLTGAGIDVYAPSLPAITTDLKISQLLTKLTMSAYLIGFALGQLFFGTLSDTRGRKITLIYGMGLFTVASIVAPMSKSISLLLAMRLLQGLGVSSPSSVCKSLLSDHFEGKELKQSATYLTTAWGLGPVLAPVIGGYLQHYLGWHYNFYFLTFYGFVGWMAVIFLVKESNLNPVPFKFKKLIGNFLAVSTHRQFLGATLLMGIGYSIIIIFNVIAPFLIQKDLGYNAVIYGHLALIIGAAFLAGSFSNRFLINYFQQKTLIRTTLFIIFCVSVFMVILLYFIKMNLYTIITPVAILVYCVGVLYPNCMSKALSLFPQVSGAATAIIGLISIASAAISSIVASSLQPATQIPMAWLYTGLGTLCLLIYWTMLRKPKRSV